MLAALQNSHSMKACAMVLIAATMSLSTAMNSYGGLAPSHAEKAGIAAVSQRQADLATIQTALESKLVGQRLTKLGFSRGEVSARLARLSDAQLHDAAQRVDGLETGGLYSLVVVAAIVALIVSLIYAVDRGHI